MRAHLEKLTSWVRTSLYAMAYIHPAETLDAMDNKPSYSYPDVWISPDLKLGIFDYY